MQDRDLYSLTIFFYSLILIVAVCPAQAADFQFNSPSTVIDQAGRRVTVKEPFKRIISLYGAHTENLFALSAGKQVIGVGQNDNFPPRVAKKKKFSYHQGPEVFLAARPDLVLIRPMIDRGYPKLVSRLEDSDITIVSLQPQTIEEMKTYWKILGLLTGHQNKAKDMLEAFRKRLSMFSFLRKKLSDPKHVYFESIHAKMKTFSQQSISMFALRSAGGINIAQDARQVRDTNIAEYGKEKILAKAFQIDAYISQQGPMNQISKADIRKEPGFDMIRAVRNDQIFLVKEEIVSRPTLRLLKGIYTIGNFLYPELFENRVKQAVQDTLDKFYAEPIED